MNREYDILHKDLQQLIKVLEKRNKIEEDRNKIFKYYTKYSDNAISQYLNKEE